MFDISEHQDINGVIMRQRINGHHIAWIVILIGTLALICSGYAGKVALLILGVAINLPVWALFKTGNFTYWPAVESAPIEKFKTVREKPFRREINQICNKVTVQKTYNLDDIPYPPKRVTKQLANLPSSNGLGSSKSNVLKAPECAILSRKPSTPTRTGPTGAAVPSCEGLPQRKPSSEEAAFEDKLIAPMDVFL